MPWLRLLPLRPKRSFHPTYAVGDLTADATKKSPKSVISVKNIVSKWVSSTFTTEFFEPDVDNLVVAYTAEKKKDKYIMAVKSSNSEEVYTHLVCNAANIGYVIGKLILVPMFLHDDANDNLLEHFDSRYFDAVEKRLSSVLNSFVENKVAVDEIGKWFRKVYMKCDWSTSTNPSYDRYFDTPGFFASPPVSQEVV